MFQTWLYLAAAVALASAASKAEEQEVKRASVKIVGNGVTGTVTFILQDDGKLRITGTVVGMPSGEHAFYIHETGDITQGCNSTGGHFNPDKTAHGHPEDENRHVGDLGNIFFDANKSSKFDFVDRLIQFKGKNNILGRALVIHAGTDDYKETESAGAGVACGVIGIL